MQVACMTGTKMKSYDKYKEDKWQNFKEKLDYLKSYVDIHYLLVDLGLKIRHETPKELRGECPIHGGDNKTAFRFNKETRTWTCFTRRCHERFGNDIIGLIKATTGKDFIPAVEHLREIAGDIGTVDFVKVKRDREIQDFIKSYDDTNLRPKSVNQKSLEAFKTLRSAFFIKEGFKKSTLDHFEIAGGWQDKHGLIRDIIPIRNDRGELVAYSLRDIREEAEEDSKYIHTPGFDKDNCLYNLEQAQKYVGEVPLIVVEGFKSVWRLYEYGIRNVVATMGSTLTEGQQGLVMAHSMHGIIMFYDNDVAGVNGTLKAIEDLNGKLDVRPVFIQEVDERGKGLDPADLTKEQVYEYLATYFIKKESY